jgi:amino acid adenylation domain-containing protein
MQDATIQGFRLSPQQRHVWQLQQTGDLAYRVWTAVSIDGPLEIDALEAAVQAVVTQHEILRTTFHHISGMEYPLQVIDDDYNCEVQLVDLTNLPGPEQDTAIEALFHEASCLPFDYERAPLLRLSLAQSAATKNLLVISLPALCADAAGIAALVVEIARAYVSQFVIEGELPESLQYADVSEILNDLLESSETAAGRDYWRKNNFESAVLLKLPFAEGPGTRESFEPGFVGSAIDEDLAGRLEDLAVASGFSLQEYLQASWNILLWKLTGETNVTVSVAYAGRTYEGLDRAPGLFARYLPLSCHLEGDFQVRDILNQVRQSAREANEWQEYFTWDNESGPRFDKTLNAQSASLSFEFVDRIAPLQLAQLRWIVKRQEGCTDRFKIKLRCLATGGPGNLRTELHYDGTQYPRENIAALSRQYHSLLSSVVQNPNLPLDQLEILDDPERQRLLVEYNQTARDFGAPHCLHQLFEAQVERAPEAIALISDQDDEQLSYAELNIRSNRLAHLLISFGIVPESRVALLLERSTDMLVSILATLKAGAAYLPLDPDYPATRLLFMLSDASPRLVITDSRIAQTHSATLRSHTVLTVDTLAELLATQPDTNPSIDISTESLAYVIYTSGSTGKPKGVAVEHRSIANRLLWMQDEFPLHSTDRVLQKTAISFDASIWEMFVPLMSGALVVLARAGGQRDTAYLLEVMERTGVTVLQMVPSILGVLLSEKGLSERCGKLRRVYSGGEALTWEMQEKFYSAMGGEVELINLYGPTEASIDATSYLCERALPQNGQTVSIGSPIANLQVYILNAGLKPITQGLAGELYIGGAGLARGYLNRPDVTAERFIPHPFGGAEGERLYRTGDLARYLPDGQVEFLGRRDQQVKVRGFRIEIGEIETALTAHPAVGQSVVTVREDVPGEKRLIAYLVTPETVEIDAGEWRAYLKESLPDYMIPSAFVTLDALPLLISGKLDRASLPAPDQTRPLTQAKFVAPETPVEVTLAEIWMEVLRLPQVGVYDNFFDLGGDSIRSIQVKAQARQKGLDFSIDQLFQHQTIHELVQVLKIVTTDSIPEKPSEPFSLISAEDRLRLPDDIEDAYPLAVLQSGMLFHREYSPETALYHDVATYHLKGRLDSEALHKAVRRIAANHPMLRTSFGLKGYSEPLQMVHREAEIPLEEFDLSHLSESQQKESLDSLMDELSMRPFDLSEAPLLRFLVHLRGPESFQFTMNCHHVILDGWSVATMVTEMFHLYFYFLGQVEAEPVPSPTVTFRDFVALEKKALASTEASDYWKQRLRDSTVTMMPRFNTDQPSDYKAQPILHQFLLSAEVSEGLKRLAHAASTPVRSVLLAAHFRVMSLLAGRADVITGVVSNCRPEEVDGERALGLFLNTVPFRMTVKGGSWVELVRETFAAEQGMLPHRWYPLARIQQDLGVRPLFESVFNFIHFHVYESIAGFEDIQPIANGTFEQTNYPLTTTFIQGLNAQQLNLGLECDPAVFGAEQSRAVLDYYIKALETMALEPEARYENCTLLSDAEEHQLLRKWNETQADYLLDQTLPELFEQQVERTPDATALNTGDGQPSLSYSELNLRANQLAHFLIASGISTESLVALMLERSTEMLVSILAILKAGAAYLPLDLDYPAERLSAMLSDSAPALLITDSMLAHSHSAALDMLPLLKLDTISELLGDQPETNPASGVDVDSLAYVIYTSGSTGMPKGVAISHRSIANRLLWMQDEFPLNAEDRVLQKTSYSFDASIWEMFAPLLNGAQVVLAKPGGQKDSGYLVEVMAKEGVTVLQMVPSMLGVLLGEKGLKERCGKLRRVFSGGEALTWEMQERFYGHMGENVELVNLYGPTEASIDASYRRCSPVDRHRGKVMIGRAISNMELYVLDERRRLAPVGVAGELYLGGVGVARGYLRRPQLTAERFIPNPLSRSEGQRLYQTGDVVRRMWDGELEYVGRADHQVKVRGYRIELGEIESAMRKLEGVREAVVIAREDEPGDKRLVAYLVANPGELAAKELSAEMRRRLGETLPDYMVPSAVVLMEKMPRLANSKIDRNALPALDRSSQAVKHSYIAPRTPVEEVLAAIWAHALRVDQVSIDDDFFNLGGHSLTATLVFSRIRETFQIEMPLRALFDEPTVRRLSRVIEAARQSNSGSAVPPIERLPREGHPPLSFAQQRLWFLDQLEPGNSAQNLPSAIRLRGSLDISALRQSLDYIVNRHETLRTTFETVKGIPVQVIAPEAIFDLPIIDLQHLPEAEKDAEMRQLAHEAAGTPFDLARGPLLRLSLLKLAAEDHVALLTMHHIVSDGWSVGVFVRELTALYESFARGELPELPELPIQYSDYATWQRAWLQGEVLDSQFAYWKQQLEDAPAVVELPADHPRPALQTFNGANKDHLWSRSLTDSLKTLSQREGVSLFITLLAAFQTLVNWYSGEEHVVIGTDVANRNRGESEGLIGFFVNQLVLSANLSGNPGFRRLLSQVRDVTLDAYAHQDLPFDKLVELLRRPRDLSRTPLFQLKIVYQNAPLQPLELPGLTLTPLEFGGGTAKYDLTLFLEDTEQGLSLTFQYNSDLFEAVTINRLSDHFEILVGLIAERPEATLSELKAALDEADKKSRSREKSKMEMVNLERFRTLQPKAVRI